MNKLVIGILLGVLLVPSVYGQETPRIKSFDSGDFSFEFSSKTEKYHVVESASELGDWSVVAHFFGANKNFEFKDYRKQFRESGFYRLVTDSGPFSHGLYEREWKLVAMHEADKTILPKSGRVHSIEFGRDNRVSGKNDCNRYFGKCSVKKGNWLNFNSPFGSTLMFCMSGSLDFKFFESLKLAKGFEVKGNRLRIYYGNNAEYLMEFEDVSS